jgi:hypothetical protein
MQPGINSDGEDAKGRGRLLDRNGRARWPAAPARESRELDCALAGDAGAHELGLTRAGGSGER